MAKITLTDVTAGYNSATTQNANNTAIEAAVENTLSRDGTSPNTMEATLDMNSNRITNLPTAVNNTEPVTLGQANTLAGVTNPLTQDSVAAVLWPQTAAELSAGVTPVNYEYEPGNVLRYVTNSNPGTTDCTAGLQAAIDSNGIAYVPDGTYAITEVTIPSNGGIHGASKGGTLLQYTGSGKAITNATPTARIYRWSIRDLKLNDGGTGTLGIELSSVSLSDISNVDVVGFTVGIECASPTSGYSVYNRFYNVLSQCPTGFKMSGTSSNAHVFVSCRTNLATTRGVDIDDSNDNKFFGCQFESGGTGTAVYINASAALADGNQFVGCRIETYSSGVGYHIASANVRDTQIVFPLTFSTVTTPLTDSGTRTQVWGSNGGTQGDQMISALSSAKGSPWTFERTVSGGANVPAMKIVDSLTTTGTPTTLQVESGRTTGTAIRVLDGVGGTESFGVEARGRIRTNQDTANINTPSGATAHQLPIYNESGDLLGYIPVYGSAW